MIIVSDFLDEGDCDRSLQFLADFGHELMLVHLWAEEDRVPPWSGQLDLTDVETAQRSRSVSIRRRAKNIPRRSTSMDSLIQRVALRNSGRYIGLPTSTTIEEAVFGSLARSGGSNKAACFSSISPCRSFLPF